VEYLQFHTEVMPQMAEAGARYVVVAYCGTWSDGEVTNDAAQIPLLQRRLRKRYMNRFATRSTPPCHRIATARFS
jgi:hypothetical protein